MCCTAGRRTANCKRLSPGDRALRTPERCARRRYRRRDHERCAMKYPGLTLRQSDSVNPGRRGEHLSGSRSRPGRHQRAARHLRRASALASEHDVVASPASPTRPRPRHSRRSTADRPPECSHRLPGVRVGHTRFWAGGDSGPVARTGVTALWPQDGNPYAERVLRRHEHLHRVRHPHRPPGHR